MPQFMKIYNIKLTLFVITVLLSTLISAQENTAPQPTLESPYNAIYVHLYYLQADTYRPGIAAQTIHPSAEGKREELAVKLKQVLDGRGLYVRLNQLPKAADYLDTLTDKNYYTPFPSQLPQVYLERSNGKWYYSRETVKALPGLYRKTFPLGAEFLRNMLPIQSQKTFLGLKAWQYLGIVVVMLFLTLLHLLLSRFLRPMVNLVAHRKFSLSEYDRKTIQKLSRYLSLIVITWFAEKLVPSLLLPIKAAEFVNKSLEILMASFFVLLGIFIVDAFTTKAEKITESTESRMDDQLLPILNRIFKIVVFIFGLFYVLKLLEVNVAALIAGISIGGIALALAAQDTVRNFIGSAMIFFDRPYQVGDFIVGDGIEGTIEEVGFRTTRIRKVDTSMLSVPNGSLANMNITNLGVRYFRMLNLTLGVLYSTPVAKIEEFVQRLKQMVADNPMLSNEPVYVHLNQFSASSLDILFRCYINVNDFAEELEHREQVILEILRIAEDIGISFAFPSTSMYIEQQNWMEKFIGGDRQTN